MAIEIPPINDFHPAMRVFLAVATETGDRAEIAFLDNAFLSMLIELDVVVAEQSSTYEPDPYYWRLREASGTVYYESSLDGANWELEAARASTAFKGAIRVSFGVVCSDPLQRTISIHVPSFNVVP